MESQIKISVIVPVFNGEAFIKRCLEVLSNQNFDKSFEIVIVNDASTDRTLDILKKSKLKNLKIYSLKTNSGQSAARNLGLKKSSGDYIFFQDIDDIISKDSLKILYSAAKIDECDFVCSDFKRIENSENQREDVFNYPKDMLFDNNEIIKSMIRELHDPTLGHLGLFGCNGRLIKRSIIIDNKIFFEEKLRWLEDKTFCWDVLSRVKNARYLRKQLYSYYVYPEMHTAVTESLNRGFPLEYIKLIVQHIGQALKRKNLSKEEVIRLCEQGLIFFSIQVIVSISRSMVLEKINFKKGKEIRKNIIKEILKDKDVSKAIKNYKPSKKESPWIPKAIALNSSLLVEIACNHRAKEVVGQRRKGIM